jgi:hypothetical protein
VAISSPLDVKAKVESTVFMQEAIQVKRMSILQFVRIQTEYCSRKGYTQIKKDRKHKMRPKYISHIAYESIPQQRHE